MTYDWRSDDSLEWSEWVEGNFPALRDELVAHRRSEKVRAARPSDVDWQQKIGRALGVRLGEMTLSLNECLSQIEAHREAVAKVRELVDAANDRGTSYISRTAVAAILERPCALPRHRCCSDGRLLPRAAGPQSQPAEAATASAIVEGAARAFHDGMDPWGPSTWESTPPELRIPTYLGVRELLTKLEADGWTRPGSSEAVGSRSLPAEDVTPNLSGLVGHEALRESGEVLEND